MSVAPPGAVLAFNSSAVIASDTDAGRRSPPKPSLQQWELVWSDEFDGTAIDGAKWTVAAPSDPNFDGGVNSYDPGHVSLGDGDLVIRSDVAPSATPGESPAYLSGKVKMASKFRFGKIEIRAKLPEGQGLWPAIWLLPADGSWPPEVDVMEMLGNDPQTIYMTNHWGARRRERQTQGTFTGPDFTADYHTFTLEWEPGRMRWLVDGVERWTVRDHVPSKAMYVILNTSVGGDWPGAPDHSTAFPQFFDIDYVRVFNRTTKGA